MVPLIWAIGGLALVLSEFIIPEFVIFFFGMGALLNAFLIAVIPGLPANIPLQIIIWLGLSSVSLFGLRRYLARWFKGSRFSRERVESEVVGKSAVVIEEIGPDRPGRIKFGGTTWLAESFDQSFRVGEKVEILKRDGMKFIVTDSIMGLPTPLPAIDAGETPAGDEAQPPDTP